MPCSAVFVIFILIFIAWMECRSVFSLIGLIFVCPSNNRQWIAKRIQMSTHSKCCLLTELNNWKTSFIDLKKKYFCFLCFCLHQRLWLLPTLAKRRICDGLQTKKSAIWMSICNLINNFSKHGIPIYFDGKQSPRNENVNCARRWRCSTMARLARIQRHWRQQ